MLLLAQRRGEHKQALERRVPQNAGQGLVTLTASQPLPYSRRNVPQHVQAHRLMTGSSPGAEE